MAHVNLVLDGEKKQYFRFSNQYAEEIKDKLKQYYVCHGLEPENMSVALCSSGMHAINSTIDVIMSKWGWDRNVCIVIGDEMYCDTPRSAKYHSNFYTGGSMRVHKVSVQNSDKVIDLFSRECIGKRVLFLMEPCTNPNGHLFDFNIVGKLRTLCKQMVLVADNTWTPEMNVLDMGADAIAISLTKHHSGSNCIMGAVITRGNGICNEVSDHLRLSGCHISPYNCYILLQMMISMEERISKAHSTALKVAVELEKRPWVQRVMFPSLRSHPSFELGEIYGIRPTVMNILMEIPVDRKNVDEWIKARKDIYFSTSYGSKQTRIDPWYKRHNKTSKYWIRLAIGYESRMEDIIASLDTR